MKKNVHTGLCNGYKVVNKCVLCISKKDAQSPIGIYIIWERTFEALSMTQTNSAAAHVNVPLQLINLKVTPKLMRDTRTCIQAKKMRQAKQSCFCSWMQSDHCHCQSTHARIHYLQGCL